MYEVKIDELLMLAVKAGDAIMEVYHQEFVVDLKEDLSPVTDADKRSNQILVNGLQHFYPGIPIISEELKYTPYLKRKKWEYFWLIDPLDGTKEFIKRNGEFSINIALIHKNYPVIGIIYLPDKRTTYYAKQNEGSYKIDENGEFHRIYAKMRPDPEKLVIVGSRSHTSAELYAFVAEKRLEFKHVELVSCGSSIKFCRVAEGSANIYLRTGSTMEWDTAAGHAIVIESGKQVYIFNTNNTLTYNKESLRNEWFLVR